MTNISKLKVNNNLKKILAQKKMSGLQLARDLDVPNQWIYSLVMREDYSPSLKTALKISKQIDVPIEEIWDLIED